MGAESIEISIGTLVVCIIIYFIYAGKNRKEYALLHLIEKYTSKQLTSDILEEELKEILHDRDEIVKDDFDKVIGEASVIDLEDSLNFDNFLKQIAPVLASGTGVDKNRIVKLLNEREKETSTAITSFFAIPQIAVEEKCYNIVIARCKKGIKFPDGTNIKAVVIILGSKEHRSLHLRTFSALAHIVQHKNI